MVNKLGPWVIGLVSLVWAVNFFAPFVFKSYSPDPAIHGIFMVIVGGLLGLQSRSKDDSGTTSGSRELEAAPDKAAGKATGGDKS